ncbi:MAG: primosomal protein N' [Gomphosphaeria aponina SAG 52.96 = DSM 107014]|uniref:Replication restart protein PriA n=1 Tax=Gomphosphaeria aponina SAG 52.96 = DSM 107014 TaxID=1521640 RepID=A0A941JQA7_9CHRO|nr:primosomal protein N' [Gomphosphaeria aponina SAG 52.96 = DSM 107014]
MYNQHSALVLAEPKSSYQLHSPALDYIEVLIDCPGVEGLYTYRLPGDLAVQPGDILSLPFGGQMVGAIAIRLLQESQVSIEINKIREVEGIIAVGFFPPYYWQLLLQVAEYYCTDIMTVVRVALPPGILRRSQRRIRLLRDAMPPGAASFLSIQAQEILQTLQAQKEGDYSAGYLQQKFKRAASGLRELLRRGWVESYLAPPKTTRPKVQKAVTLVTNNFPFDLTEKQREVLEVLKQRGGELWLSELLKICNASSSIVTKLEEKGCVVSEAREVLRFLNEQHSLEGDRVKELTAYQKSALQQITGTEGYAQILLHGVTGSGKTEVYLQAIAPILQQGQGALVLVPEIGLTPQLTDRFRARFGNKVFVYHSALSEGERYDTWREIQRGEPRVIIGTRSAVFAPLPNLGLIILDEEHDSSFKQDQQAPTYHARTVATFRAQLENFPLILGSATPSLESWLQVKSNIAPNHHYLSLPERIQSRPLPPIEIVDMRLELQRGNRSIFSLSLGEALENLQNNDQQAILFISRRGHSTFVSCRSCGYVIGCPHCDVSLSYHYTHEGATELLRCHYCNHSALHPTNCPECGSPYLKCFGSGTQRVTQELNQQFPNLRLIRYDSDTTRTKGAHRMLLQRFANKEADVLVGTQMITKGLDLARVTLVGVVAADGLLHHSDYRASERAFQTLTQVAGRAGRGDEPGRVIIQTYSPEHPVIEAVKNYDYLSFTETELQQRFALNYPPAGRLILLRLSGMDDRIVQEVAEMLAESCQKLVGEEGEILGPAPNRVMRVARRYRWQILLKLPSAAAIPNLTNLRSQCPHSVSMTIDIDPLNMD